MHMKSLTNKALFVFSLLAIISCKNDQEYSFESFRGESFPFHSPITSIAVGKDSSIILGTARGIIASFNPDNGLFTELESHDCGTIYDLCPHQGRIYFSVQDGGVRRGESEVLRIDDKDIQYSPYNISFDKKGALLAATSNGAYRWEKVSLSSGHDFAKPVMKLKKAAPMRIYDIEARSDGSVVFAGDTGLYRIHGGDTAHIFKQAVFSMHDGYFLTKNGELYKASAPSDKIAQFKNNPLAFQVVDTLVYASSLNGVEIAETNGVYRRQMLFPHNNPQRVKNESLRNICIVHGPYLYMVSGDEFLYRIPLGIYEPSERIVSICSNKRGTIYALSEKNDLYVSKDRKRISYVRSFPLGDRVQLLDSFGDTLIVLHNEIPNYYVGSHKTFSSKVFYNTNLKNKVTCRYFPSSNTLYEGRIDCIREYSPRFPRGRSLDVSSVFSGKDTLDYYPTFIEKVKDRLVFATLHSGVYAETGDKDKKFVSLLDSSKHIKAISGVDSLAFILTTDSLYRFRLDEQSFDMPDVWSTKVLGSNSRYLNGMVSTSDNLVYLYSSDYRFFRGIYKCELSDNGEMNSICLSNTSSISDALPLNGHELVFSGNMGIESSDKIIQDFFKAPSWLARHHANTFPWGYFVVLLFGLAVYAITRALFRWHDYIQIQKVERLSKKTVQEYQEALSNAHTVLTEKMLTRSGKQSLEDYINEWRSKHDKLLIDEEVIRKKRETVQQYDGVIAVAENIKKGLLTPEAKESLTTLTAQYKKEHDKLVINDIEDHDAITAEECSSLILKADSALDVLYTKEGKVQLRECLETLKQHHDSIILAKYRGNEPETVEVSLSVLSEAKAALDLLQTPAARVELLSFRKELKKKHDDMLLKQIDWNVGSVQQCDEIIEKLEAALSSQLITNEYCDKVRRIIKDLTQDRFELLAKEKQNKETAFEFAWDKAASVLCSGYGSEYIKILLETQKEDLKEEKIHNLDIATTDSFFKGLSQECDVVYGSHKVNRLELLDGIGVLVADATDLVRNPKDKHISQLLPVLIEKYFQADEQGDLIKCADSVGISKIDKRFPELSEVNNYYKHLEKYEKLSPLDIENARAFQFRDENRATVRAVELLANYLRKDQISFLKAFRTKVIKKMRIVFEKQVEMFFKSYLEEDTQDPYFKQLFITEYKEGYKWYLRPALFLILPVGDKYDNVANELMNSSSAHSRKTELKSDLSVVDDITTPVYSGLIRLIAKTISRKKDNRTKTKPV